MQQLQAQGALTSLGGGEVAQALDDPALVVTLTKFRQRASQFLHVLEYPDLGQAISTVLGDGATALACRSMRNAKPWVMRSRGT